MSTDTPTHTPIRETTNRQASDLLDELESIKSLLGDDIEQIPLLEEMVEDTQPLATATHSPSPLNLTESTGETTPAARGVLPGQQALFDSHQSDSIKQTTQKQPPQSKQAVGENPFLPQHIRKRLGASSAEIAKSLANTDRELEKQSLIQPTHEDSRFIPHASQAVVNKTTQASIEKKNTPTPDSLKATIANPDDIIDALVQQYLPIIEDELRRQLEAIAQGKSPQ